MADDIEEFLRRAIQRRMEAEKQNRGGAGGQQPAPQQAPRPLQPPPRRQAPQRGQQTGQQQPARPRTIASPVDQPMVIEAEVVDGSVDMRSRKMQHELDRDFRSSSEISQRVERLGQEVGLADDKIDAHLHATFDHEVGSLGKSRSINDEASVARPDTSPIAREVMTLLANPKSLAAAFILNEILQPVGDRFEKLQ